MNAIGVVVVLTYDCYWDGIEINAIDKRFNSFVHKSENSGEEQDFLAVVPVREPSFCNSKRHKKYKESSQRVAPLARPCYFVK